MLKTDPGADEVGLEVAVGKTPFKRSLRRVDAVRVRAEMKRTAGDMRRVLTGRERAHWERGQEDARTVGRTPSGKKQEKGRKEKAKKGRKRGGAEGSFDYVVYGERKDIDKLEIEPLKV